jgi:hypothetical protein
MLLSAEVTGKDAASGALPFQILMDDLHEFLGGRHARIVAAGPRIDHVLTDMVFDHFGDETVQGASTRRRLLQYIGALLVALDRPFNGFDLTPQSFDPIQELGLFICNVTHISKILWS